MSRVETISRTLYKFDDLEDSAKETARDWWRSCEASDFEADFEDFETIAAIFGIQFKTHSVKLGNGSTRQASNIYYSGFASQGDGACFEANYSYKKGAAKEIRKYAPLDATLHAIADKLQQVQSRNFYQLSATCLHRGHYYHEYCMSVSVDDSRSGYSDMIGDDADSVTECLRDFARWIYRSIESDYDYRMSDENVDESIRINEYEFDESGNIA